MLAAYGETAMNKKRLIISSLAIASTLATTLPANANVYAGYNPKGARTITIKANLTPQSEATLRIDGIWRNRAAKANACGYTKFYFDTAKNEEPSKFKINDTTIAADAIQVADKVACDSTGVLKGTEEGITLPTSHYRTTKGEYFIKASTGIIQYQTTEMEKVVKADKCGNVNFAIPLPKPGEPAFPALDATFNIGIKGQTLYGLSTVENAPEGICVSRWGLVNNTLTKISKFFVQG